VVAAAAGAAGVAAAGAEAAGFAGAAGAAGVVGASWAKAEVLIRRTAATVERILVVVMAISFFLPASPL
jgi:hypothetical protein